MAYEKQNFEDGTVLEAEHLNHIEDGMVEIENEVAGKQPKGYYITEETDPTVPEWAKNEKKPAYTAEEVGARPEDWTPSAEDVGADPAGTATAEVSGHNVDADAHSDIRIILEELKTAVTAFLDVDDETKNELSEVLALIDANKTSIQEITSGKVNVKDIVDNLTTNLSKRALSAAQGVVLKAMIDALQKLIDALQTSLSNHTSDGTAHITAAERAAWNNKQPAGNYSEEGHTHSQYAKQTDLEKQAEEIVDLDATTLKEVDRQSIVEDVVDSVIFIEGEPNPNVYAIYGEVDAENNIILHGTLEEEDYYVKYEMQDGTLIDIGELSFVPEIEERIIQCAYIESTDMTSYVDLGYVTTETTGMQVTFEIAQSGTYSNVSFFGNSDIACGATSADSDMRAYIGGVKSYQLIAAPAVNTEYIVGVNYQNSGKASFNGIAKSMNSGTKTFQKKDTLTLCKQNGGAQYSRGYYTRIKEVYISEGVDIVKHYVPAYRSTDGAIGVLETNSNTFIVGTGNFTKGADVV